MNSADDKRPRTRRSSRLAARVHAAPRRQGITSPRLASRSSRPHHPVPTQDQIAGIVAMRDPVLRNLQITQTYHELKLALADLLGAKDVTWCAYATWASKTAGRFIRGDVLEEARLRPALDAIFPRIAGVVARVQSSVAEGNLVVFEELAPPYAALVELLRTSPRPDPARREAFLARFVPGPVERGGQDMLRRAFACYYDFAFVPERESKRRSELMFLANALVGYHEQTRLQGPIEGALRAPVDLLLPRRGLGAIGGVLAGSVTALTALLDGSLRALSTRWFMALDLPLTRMSLGENVPSLPSGGMFPEDLRSIEDLELQALLARLDRTPDTTSGSAAGDWADLGDRMNFVVDFFRSRQQDPSLYRAPFTAAQTMAIHGRQVPLGPL